MKKLFLLSIAITILFSLTSVSAFVYDDFSGSTLNLTKWSEDVCTDISYQHVDEHYLNTNEQRYHTAQLTTADRGTLLIMNRNINPGEVVEFDTYHVSGSGNHESWVWLGSDVHLLRELKFLTECTTPWQGCGYIGYWNGVPDVGNTLGKYHIKVAYSENEAEITFTRPDMTNITHRFNITDTYPNHRFGVCSRTGHNGLLHFDYDNFTISGFPPTTTTTTSTTTTTTIPCNCTELTERVEELESRTSLLEYFIELIICNLLPRGLRKGVTCPVY